MQPSDQTPPDAPRQPADLSRLRIERGDEAVVQVRGFPWLALVSILGVLALLYLFRAPLLSLVGGSGAPSVRTARAVKVVPGQAQAGDVSANGYIVADKQASLASILSGRLVELNAAEGDTVEQGAVVARIQYDDLEVQERQAQAARKTAAARSAQAAADAQTAAARATESERDHAVAEQTGARLDAEIEAQQDVVKVAGENRDHRAREVIRNRKLIESKLIDAGVWDQIQTAARTAQVEYDAAQKRQRALTAGKRAWTAEVARRKAAWDVALRAAEAAAQAHGVATAGEAEARHAEDMAAIQLEKTRIRAPFTGLVIRKDAEKGEVISPLGAGNSRGSVLTIVDPTSLEVQVELSERRIGRVAPGDRAVTFLDADPENGLPGAVRKIWPRADRSKGSIEVRVKLDAIPADLRPDMAARVVFKGEEAPAQPAAEPYVTVPRAALAQRKGKTVVFVVRDGTARQVSIVRGAARGSDVVVASGLDGGESVVLEPAADLADGARVRTGE